MLKLLCSHPKVQDIETFQLFDLRFSSQWPRRNDCPHNYVEEEQLNNPNLSRSRWGMPTKWTYTCNLLQVGCLSIPTKRYQKHGTCSFLCCISCVVSKFLNIFFIFHGFLSRVFYFSETATLQQRKSLLPQAGKINDPPPTNGRQLGSSEGVGLRLPWWNFPERSTEHTELTGFCGWKTNLTETRQQENPCQFHLNLTWGGMDFCSHLLKEPFKKTIYPFFWSFFCMIFCSQPAGFEPFKTPSVLSNFVVSFISSSAECTPTPRKFWGFLWLEVSFPRPQLATWNLQIANLERAKNS